MCFKTLVILALFLLPPGIGWSQFVRLNTYQAAARCAEVEEGDQQLEIIRSLPLRMLYISQCTAEGHVDRLRLLVNATDAAKAKDTDIARAWVPMEVALLKRSGISVTALFGSADLVGLPAPPSDRSLKGQILGWDGLSQQNPALTNPATARLAEVSHQYCPEVSTELQAVKNRNAFEVVALASMLFVCDRAGFRRVDWNVIMEQQPRAAIEVNRLIGLDALSKTEGVDLVPTSLIFFSHFPH